MPIRLLAGFLAALAILVVATACSDDDSDSTGASSTEASAPIPAEVILDWFPNADHASIYTAKEQGLFADSGLDVKLTVPSDPAAALKQVAANRAEFAISYEPEVILARSQDIPVTAVAAIVNQPLNSLIVRKDRGISRPRDLEGKNVGATGLPSDRALLETVVRSDGGDPSKVTITNVGFTLGPAIVSGKVDALIGAYWNIEVPEIEDKGVDVEVFRLDEHGVPDYDELVLVTSEKVIAQNPELVKRMVRGLQSGALAAERDTEAAAAAVLAANPDLNADLLASQVAETTPLLASRGDGEELLSVDPNAWSSYADWMRAEGLLTKDLQITDAVNPGFVEEPSS